MSKIAVTHPGKIGDCLYSLPAIRCLCMKYGEKADFWTSKYCSPLKRLMEYQSCIDEFHINEDYVMQHKEMGIQPWHLPVPNEKDYEVIYHLGFRAFPNKYQADYICEIAGVPTNQKIYYDYPDVPTLEQDYIVVAPKKENFWIKPIEDLNKSIAVVQIGAKEEYVGKIGIDKTGLDLLETTTWIAKAKAFMGGTSSQLVIAEGFQHIPRYVKPMWQNAVMGF